MPARQLLQGLGVSAKRQFSRFHLYSMQTGEIPSGIPSAFYEPKPSGKFDSGLLFSFSLYVIFVHETDDVLVAKSILQPEVDKMQAVVGGVF